MSDFHLTRRGLLTAAGALGIGTGARPAAAQGGWDSQPETRPTSTVVPAEMVRGPQYVLDPAATTFDYLNRFSAVSDYGPFVAPSEARLRRLIREIAAITELKRIQQTDAFAKAAIEAGKSPIRSAKNLIEDPVNTLSAIPEGIGSLFNRVTEQVNRSGGSQYEDGLAKEVLAVSSFKRELAAKLGVDVYSSNEVLQQELNRVAWASAAGNLSLGAFSMATGAMALQVASSIRVLEQARNVVEATPASELSRQNREQLRRMQVPAPVMDQFLRNRLLSPRHQTVIVTSMVALGQIPGRADFVSYTTQADTEDEALLFQQMAELLAGYSALVASVQQIRIFVNLPVAYTATGEAVLLLPIDRLLWTGRSAALAANLAQNLPKPQPVQSTAIWMTGDGSALAKAGVRQVGLGFQERCGERLPLLD
jgi:hypothetical protein